ncbi:MAG: heme-binding domain-containing protein [Chitinophagaceae bacterium]|jgi:DNA replicative helicase MCM subunit Mcm2 (Cdc46/Mcm family)|nr:heme-binding domain-containing protein [Chitinophagaceae bacterium]MBK7680912.1 heme-binding domain-containing protein [Chitinophagaceae bacterium]MBK8300841.1 heme-binding domain-containing protein [Chitinophagaceae bacterium]MBK9465325.1 heme-binding domain-containing protein [Chitinophagaceae bacterium]MBK9660470.1 heme-binding domain-containing protein [Chitinophagaceae bacterium]
MFRKIMLVLLAVLVIIQFIHPKKNKAEGVQPNYIGNTFAIPADVKTILAKACYDCHSNNTRYPWYANLQPLHWWLEKHIKNGKKEINFDDYTNKSLRYQYHKMEEVIEQVKEGEMPLNSYTWIHKDAKLTTEEKAKITGWAQSVLDTMKATYPIDSLIRKK